MASKTVFFLIFLFCMSLLGSCQRKKENNVDLDAVSYLLAQPSPVQTACQRFVLAEGNCVAAPDNLVVACTNLVGAIRARITPADKATDSVVELYFNCFTNANLLYNGLISCNKSSFATNAEYRRNQRLTSGNQINANTQWRTQFNNCAGLQNGIPPADSGLRETGTQLTSDPFQ